VKILPNIKSAIKRVRVSNKKATNNTVKKSTLKSTVKKCKEGIAKNDTAAPESLKNACVALDKAASDNLIHKNTAARRKSRLTKAYNAAKK
jgi:small subunit ribosomal protein S20